MEGAVRRLWGSREEQEQRAHRLQHRNMNMKQEGPFLVPQLWKDTMSLENITNDFLDSNNVTGEVMNLDDFLKELQVNELVEHAEASRRQQGEQDPRTFQPLIRPANIEALKEQQSGGPPGAPRQQSGGPPAPRPSVMQHVGKAPELHSTSRGAPELHMLQSPHTQHAPHLDHLGSEAGAGLLPHHRELALPALAPKEQGHLGIPQASVRPHVRAQVSHESRGEQELDMEDREDSQHAHTAKRMRKMSEDSEFSGDDDEEDESRSGQGNFGGFTSTVCVNFSQDDLRLATIPGQEGDFDPATRRFSEEELKPQPIIRKRKKQFVPDELKNNKYWAKRYKNNEAAKRSREARRLKENQIAMRARFLEEENTALKGEVDHLKKENSDLKHMTLALEDKLNSMIDSH